MKNSDFFEKILQKTSKIHKKMKKFIKKLKKNRKIRKFWNIQLHQLEEIS